MYYHHQFTSTVALYLVKKCLALQEFLGVFVTSGEYHYTHTVNVQTRAALSFLMGLVNISRQAES